MKASALIAAAGVLAVGLSARADDIGSVSVLDAGAPSRGAGAVADDAGAQGPADAGPQVTDAGVTSDAGLPDAGSLTADAGVMPARPDAPVSLAAPAVAMSQPEEEALVPTPLPEGPDPTPIFVPYATVNGLGGDQVRAVVQDHEREIKGCRYAALSRGVGSTGDFRLTIAIGAGGEVESVVTDSAYAHRLMAKCMAEAARRWIFPPPVGGRAEISQHFYFSAPLVFGHPTVDAGLTADQVHAAFLGSFPALWRCVQDAYDADRTLRGKVTLGWTVGASGSLSNAAVKDSELGNSTVEGCLVGVVSHMAFQPMVASVTSNATMVLDIRSRTLNTLQTEQLGGLKAADIEEVQEDHRDDIDECYADEVDGDRDLIDLAGQLTVRYVIGPDGRVRDPSIVGSSLQRPGIERCVVNQVRSWKFPAPSDGQPVETEFTRNMQPGLAPPLFKGVALGLSISDGSGLNQFNYSNELFMLLEGSWAFGKLLLPRESPFYRMGVSIRWPLTYALAGFDPSSLAQYNDHGLPSSCSDITLSETGTINPSQVQRCNYPNNYQLVPGDLWLGFGVPEIYDIPVVKLKVNPALRIVVPISAVSQYHTTILGLRLGLGFKRSFFARKLEIEYSVGGSYTWYRYTAPQIETGSAPFPNDPISNTYAVSDTNTSNTDFYASPGNASGLAYMNMPWAISNALFITYNPTDKLHIDVSYQLTDAFSYTVQCGVADYGGVMTNPCANATSVAQSTHPNGTGGTTPGATATYTQDRVDVQRFVVGVSYDLEDWVDIEATLLTDSPLRYPDNSPRQPFLWTNYDAFSTVYVGAKFSVGNTK